MMLDETTRQIVKLNEPACITCGEMDLAVLECSHFMRRGFEPTRFDIEREGNNHTQCLLCNRKHNEDRKPYEDWFIRTFGPERGKQIMEKLNARAHGFEIYSTAGLAVLLNKHREILRAHRAPVIVRSVNQPYSNDVPF